MKAKLVLCFISTISIGVILFFSGCIRRTSTEKVEHLIQQQIPVGSNSKKVIKFLDSHKIEHTDVKPYEKGQDIYIGAYIPYVSIGFIYSSNIQIFFLFDSRDKLKHFEVTEDYVAP